MARRSLSRAADSLSKSFERLSSGVRIVDGSDDPAGLAVASRLHSDLRIFHQAVRNVSDGISLLNVAEGSLRELQSIATRQQEIAEQAANGTFSVAQRRSMTLEVNALADEFNRIVETTSFNGINLLDGSAEGLHVQAGAGADAAVQIQFASEIQRVAGSGDFSSIGTFQASVSAAQFTLADVDKDSNLDLLVADDLNDTLNLFFGNGDGSFVAAVCLTTGDRPLTMRAADINNDGNLDVITANGQGSNISVFIGNGDGTFSSQVCYSSSWSNNDVAVADLDGDGWLDITVSNGSSQTFSCFLNRGDGTFSSAVSYASAGAVWDMAVEDFNSDGIKDVMTVGLNSGPAVAYGLGDGTFSASSYVSGASNARWVESGDFNFDGNMDIAAASTGDNLLTVYLGAGNGEFTNVQTYDMGHRAWEISSADLDGDGIVDLIIPGMNIADVSTLTGNGDGTFGGMRCFATSGNSYYAFPGDVNNDGALDFLSTGYWSGMVDVFLGTQASLSTVPKFNLSTIEDARSALEIAGNTLDRISLGLGQIGAAQSRMAVIAGNLQAVQLEYAAAESRIVDVDVAEETSRLAADQILQQAGAAVLMQANLQPKLALKLITG